MKKLFLQVFILLVLMLQVQEVWAKHVPQSDAQQVAVTFYRLNNPSGITAPQVQTVSVNSRDNVPTFYIFRFISGGFVLVAADDASIPILGYSFENNMPETIDNPAIIGWIDNYSREISYIRSNKLDNSETLKKWNAIKNGQRLAPAREVLPLLTTVWDQKCYYNALCPADPAGPCGHVWTGCVATTMAQIMKYHNFPTQGVGQHTYSDPIYGPQSADFEITFYDWAAMPDSVAGSNAAVATLMYHAGVSVDMQYGATGSGTYLSYIPRTLQNYFNFSPDMEMIYLPDYTDQEEFKNLLRTDLDASLPVCYGGYDTSPWGPGHSFICDGYRLSDSTFHFNLGVGGLYNGYYIIGHLNTGGYNWDYINSAVIHIKPNNPDLIVRITNPDSRNMVNPGSSVEIKAKVVRGTSTILKIYIDDFEKAVTSGDSVTYTWNIGADELGSHTIKAFACNPTDTVWYKQLVNISEWIEQASGFPPVTIPVWDLSAVDSNIVWGSTQGGDEFTRTVDGGNTWTSGVITNTQGLASSMIFGLSSLKAYVAMLKISGNKPQGIYMTSDGGITWARQTTAYNNPASWPDVIHFYNTNEGFAIGDPINNEYEIYRTTNGGNNWIPVPGGNIPNPLPGEWGIVDYYSVVQDTIWFGTNMGRVYRSVDKGLHWTVSAVPGMNGKMVKPEFRNGTHGLVMDGIWGSGMLCESFDGGISWNQVNYTGSNHHGEIDYVPGTPNTWVRSDLYDGGSGSSYSFDGGHTWTDFPGTVEITFYPMGWLNSHCGWAGGISKTSTEGGVYKYTGWVVLKPAPENVQAIVNGNNVNIAWDTPNYDPVQMTLQGYNIRRNGTKLNSSLINGLTYNDINVPSDQYTYCVTAQYNIGASEGACKNVEITVGINIWPVTSECLKIYPNPTSGKITVETTGQGRLSILNLNGRELMKQNILEPETQIDLNDLHSGIYIVKLMDERTVLVVKVVKE